jgi:hypothetical protein
MDSMILELAIETVSASEHTKALQQLLGG